ncbi:hypothetical protein G5I_02194 [Acromyrmex echinatior]|uniref:Uncharacterized protein n=1 Tax=Acromyrmex echinatior TaxID=103372 RepID=F4W9P0_ACREC|nr:hypothetical protein G5I_02194 [Acromyrmex echinatior]
MNAIRTYLVITFRGSESARTIGLQLCGTRKRSPIKVLGRYLNAALLKTGRSGKRGKGDGEERMKKEEKREANKRSGGWREEDLGLSCPKVPDESSVSSSGRTTQTKTRPPRRLLSGFALFHLRFFFTLLPLSPFSVTSDNSQRAERCRSSMNTPLVAVGKRHSSHSSQQDRDLTSTFSPHCFLTSKFYLSFDYHHVSVISLLCFRVKLEWIFILDRVNKRCECWSPRKVSRMGDIRLPIDLTLPTASVIAKLTNLFTISQEKNHQQGLMGGRFECLLVNNVPGVLDEIDVGGSADSTGVWIWMLLPRQKRPREHPTSSMGKKASLLALGKAFQNKEPRCWFNGGQYVNQWLAVVTMSRPRRPASSYLFNPSPPLPLPVRLCFP